MKRAIILLIFTFIVLRINGQSFELKDSDSYLSIFGTSTLHDWEIKAETLNGSMSIESSNEEFTISKLSFSVTVEGLKSGKSAMDNNTYKALEKSAFPTILYALDKLEITGKTGDIFQLNTTGELSIAGTKKKLVMPVNATITKAKISYQGEVTFNMTDYNIEPPTALFGSIKTGDEITIKYNVTFIRTN